MTDTLTNGTILINVNGEPRVARAAFSVRDLLAELRLPLERLAVELNRELLPRDRFDRKLAAGDQIEIVTLVGGG